MPSYYLPCSIDYEKIVHKMIYYNSKGTFAEKDVFVIVERDYVDKIMIDALLKNQDPPKSSVGGDIISTLTFVSKVPILNSTISTIEDLCEFIVHRYSYLNASMKRSSKLIFEIPETYLKVIDSNGLLRNNIKPVSNMKAETEECMIKDTATQENVSEKVASAVNPKHYKDHMIIGDVSLQWTESLQYEARFRNPEVFKGALLMQADKYLSRLGGKDNEVQEIMKAIWYLRFLAAYTANGNKPITVSDIPKLLGEV